MKQGQLNLLGYQFNDILIQVNKEKNMSVFLMHQDYFKNVSDYYYSIICRDKNHRHVTITRKVS